MLLDPENLNTRNGKLKGDNTLKHGQYASQFGSGLLDGELDATVPRRKTVGFKNSDNRKSNTNEDPRIAIDDLDNNSQSIFERASDVVDLTNPTRIRSQ